MAKSTQMFNMLRTLFTQNVLQLADDVVRCQFPTRIFYSVSTMRKWDIPTSIHTYPKWEIANRPVQFQIHHRNFMRNMQYITYYASLVYMYSTQTSYILDPPFQVPTQFPRLSGFFHGWQNAAAEGCEYLKCKEYLHIYATFVFFHIHFPAFEAYFWAHRLGQLI
jgi:hypothetical protein